MTYEIFLSDDQIAKRLGMDSKLWRHTAAALERGGFPQRDPLFQNRRHWPAVWSFLYRRAGGARTLPLELESMHEIPEMPRSTSSPKRRRFNSDILESV